MAVTTTQTLRMRFRNEAGSIVTLSLDNPRNNLTAADVQGVMDLIIAKNVFVTNGGGLVGKVDASIVDRTTNVLFEVSS
ncbi:DUF2922 domain-containing protein [Desulfovirgula thermocuniculi]|uniref:DUF2922 domain-containing protein n=1 Tax=Desulfovirgula thermocuniculi TaxID=348842 RepID=UPI00041FD228|nr:DUF2922 domain-containing protein [Desulfovirgula thermocuniculi]